jgi:acyl-CoA synthetase (AMP-forming)/AMP-acid ligase II
VTTITDLILQRLNTEPSHVAYRFFNGPALSNEVLTVYSLWEHAAGLAHILQSRGLSHQPVLLVCKSQMNFVVAFVACLLAGAVAVPTAPPRRQSLLTRFQFLARDARARAIISDCDEVAQGDFILNAQELFHIEMRVWMQSEDRAARAAIWKPPSVSEDSLAFLQYTSGSTGDPKGVAITHANLIHNCAAIADAIDLSKHWSALFALPLFHDMGLVGGVVLPIYSGFAGGFMPPAEFVQYPERWLQILSACQITLSGGPNFMYELAVRAIKAEELQGIDLSSWRIAFCGAEPIRPGTVARFAQQFAGFGFKPEAFYPCYGMAEATLFITGSQVRTPPRFSMKEGIVTLGCGKPRHDTRVEIVHPESFTKVPPESVGEIWVSGPSVAQGYWMRPELTERIFQACLSGDDTTRFLRTGDLGYIKGGDLYITGRLKDVIIVNGTKYAPQDFEDEAERSHDALRQAGGAAFSVTKDGIDRVVLVFELNRQWLRRPDEWRTIISAMRAAINTAYGVTVNDVVLIRPGSLPRTSSGKVRRSQCREDYLSGLLERVMPRDAQAVA